LSHFVPFIILISNVGIEEELSSDTQKDTNGGGRDDKSGSSVDDTEGDFTYTATPTSIIDDLSIPGAFAQHSKCSNKRCNDTECSNYRDICESTYVYFRHLACLLISLPFSLIIWYR